MRRSLALLAAAALTATATPALAAPPKAKPVCGLVRDPAGDTSSPAPDRALDSQLDITSADVATDRKNVTVVLRLASLTAADPANPQGRVYEFDFTAAEKNFIVLGNLLPGGNSFNVFISDTRFEEGKGGARAATGIGQATGVVDVVAKEVRMTAPLSVFDPYANLRAGTLYYLSAWTYRANGMSAQPALEQASVEVTTAFGIGVDEAWGRKSYYRAGAASCVKPGR
ncbi:MAG TPA: hypothetical protein VGX28_09620 [Frankiaceae bacterium]|jgi:hypothetical protein|nr:hypothetical protein [Frankiaceae bacterium]